MPTVNAAGVNSTVEIRVLSTPEAVIAELSADNKHKMIECLREELDRPQNATKKKHLDGETYIYTVLSNGWVAVYREEHTRFLGGKTLVLFDLLSPQSSLY